MGKIGENKKDSIDSLFDCGYQHFGFDLGKKCYCVIYGKRKKKHYTEVNGMWVVDGLDIGFENVVYIREDNTTAFDTKKDAEDFIEKIGISKNRLRIEHKIK